MPDRTTLQKPARTAGRAAFRRVQECRSICCCAKAMNTGVIVSASRVHVLEAGDEVVHLILRDLWIFLA